MKATPRHETMAQFPVQDNQLQIGGIPLSTLAARVGQTPFYAYDRQLISARVSALRAILPDTIHLHYAIKANSMPAVVQHLSAITDGLDVASLGEMKIALDTGVSPGNISFAGPGKTDKELTAAVAAGVIINMESEGEMERVANIGNALSIRPRVSISVNPDFELKTSGMKMGGGPKPFGIDAERVPEVLRRIGSLELDFRGFHIFSGSQNLRPEALIEAQTKTFELAWRLSEHAPSPIEWLNIGGGFGIPYFPGEKALDLAPVAESLQTLLNNYAPRLPEAEIVIELGRYLVGEAGIYVCEVIDKKVSRGETFVVTNGGLHHHLAASGNFGQVIRKNYPVCVGNRVSSGTTEVVSIVGPLCTPLDILAGKVELPVMEIGDLVVIYQSGAYGLNASPQDFLSHPHTVEVLV
ncbi:pyridoxal-dependent decarboxylase, exosortase A system-associated [Sedimenticola selenatireducens]|uniref:Pyridoxal-dependent decarboxylase, exosortase A system-associated n=1 Tax=Sedimenticola selenatireducens TaxID=191960 RepID=A0A2N6D039_9GAMM|nr:pyridoxal-dependent decarboxylase, exosortase A system-associated [Sedimenticola selenatireducens]PLX63030.1 MAG: pyridoxal-dependent decarboxylase, exosortase A system-associated [Sedimenticola selenatireducens]